MSTDPLDALDGLFDAVGDFFSDISKAFKSGPFEITLSWKSKTIDRRYRAGLRDKVTDTK